MIENPQSYMLVYMFNNPESNRFQRGMVVDVRDIGVPVGRMETLPTFSIVYSDLPVADLEYLVEDDVDSQEGEQGETIQTVQNKRSHQLNIDTPTELMLINRDGVDSLTADELGRVRRNIRQERIAERIEGPRQPGDQVRQPNR